MLTFYYLDNPAYMPNDKTFESIVYSANAREPVRMSDLDELISYKNNRGEVLCKGKVLEPDHKILMFCTE